MSPTTEKENGHSCNFPECGRKFESSGELHAHVDSHKKGGYFYCPQRKCAFKSDSKKGLLIHWRSHDSEACKHAHPLASRGTSMSDARPRTRAGNKDSKAVKPYDRRRAGTFSRISTSRKVHDGSSNDASNDNNGMDSDSDNSSCAAFGPSGLPWNGGIWPHDFLEIMEESATLSVTTGGCYYLDTPDGRKSIPAHLLLPEVYEQYGIGDNNWIILPEQEGEWTPQSELRRLEEGLCTKLYQDDIFMSLPDREGCMCPEWMLDTGIWDAPPQYRAL